MKLAKRRAWQVVDVQFGAPPTAANEDSAKESNVHYLVFSELGLAQYRNLRPNLQFELISRPLRARR